MPVGDLLLKGVADRLRTCLRESDTVARMGGNEFTFILEGIATMRDIEAVAKKILQAMATPFLLDGQEVFVSTSIGIATAIIELAHRLRRTVIAEGVETIEQLEFLRAHNCNEIQGYLISRPLPTELIEQWLCNAMRDDIGNRNSDPAHHAIVHWDVPVG